MQLSCNLIKSTSTLKASNKVIETNYVNKFETKDCEEKESMEERIKKSYEALGSNIIKKAKSEAAEIMENAKTNSSEIERKAYEEGYNQGKNNGFEDGYNEGIEKAKLDLEEEIKIKLEKSEEILKKANNEYKEFLVKKEKEILEIAFKMASMIAKKELQNDEGVLPLIEDILNQAKGEENIIIKCNSSHIKAIEEKIDYYKKAYAIKGEIFILEDTLMEEGNAVIEKSTGKAIVGLDIGLKKLEDALF